jgi:hypothetical protein
MRWTGSCRRAPQTQVPPQTLPSSSKQKLNTRNCISRLRTCAHKLCQWTISRLTVHVRTKTYLSGNRVNQACANQSAQQTPQRDS